VEADPGTATLLQVARGLYRRWGALPAAERKRMAELALELKEHALELRGRMDRPEAARELLVVSEAVAIALAEAADRDPETGPAELQNLRKDLSEELLRAQVALPASRRAA
jgi:hypothetical protein